MNEKIRELAEQAEKQVRVTTKSDMGFLGFEIDEDAFREKFAELIVKECIDAAVEAQADFYIVHNIKSRFGVEE